MKTPAHAVITAPAMETCRPSQRRERNAKNVHLLSIGSFDRSDALHDSLLQIRNLHTYAIWKYWDLRLILDYRELWVIPKHDFFHVAIVHDTLSPFELDEACHFIRRQWPDTRILVIRADVDFLDDALYDDRVSACASPEALMMAIERLMERRRQ